GGDRIQSRSRPRPYRRCRPSRPDLCWRWPSRLGATAEEDRLNTPPANLCDAVGSFLLSRPVLFAKAEGHSSHLSSWQSLPPSPGTAFPHRGHVMQVLSAPINARTFLSVNTAGAVPGEASVARNIARSRSLREPGFLAIVALYRFSKPPGSNLGHHVAECKVT